MSSIAIIPARAGSKGIPNKNLQLIEGQSLLDRAIKICSSVVDEVLVSSDGKEILDAAKRAGANTIERPKGISGDSSSSESALLHALTSLEIRPEITVFYQCTSPFTEKTDVRSAIELVDTGEFDSVFSAREDHSFRWNITNGALMPDGHPLDHRPLRQELPTSFRETGAFYVFNTEGFMKSGFRHFGRIGYVIETSNFSIDIDTEQDLQIARILASVLESW